MRHWSRFALALVATAAFAPVASAQNGLIGLDKAHQLLSSNQPRLAARELGVVSADFRTEIGRCRDGEIGARLMELEPKIDALATRINSGALTSAAALAKEFVAIDHALAESHHQLAAQGWMIRRVARVDAVAHDLVLAARYYERSMKWSGPIAPEQQALVDDALAMAQRLEANPANPPAEAGAVIEALGKALKGTN
jgi:hypothetical protein